MGISSNLGFPRMGVHRELKKALEAHWAGKLDESSLLAVGQVLKLNHWLLQQQLGIQHIPSNDFSVYDHVLDTAAMVGAVPERYTWRGPQVDLATYFAMARGTARKSGLADVPAMEMTKWFDTNYHYIVPEFTAKQIFSLGSMKPVEEFLEAKAVGVHTRPVLLGPVSFLLLGKAKETGFNPLLLLEGILPVYEEVLRQLANAEAEWVQIDEPMLALDTRDAARRAFTAAYERLSQVSTKLRILVATYFEGLGANLATAVNLPVAALHLDLVRAPEQLDDILRIIPWNLQVSLGLIDGRNVWKADLGRALHLVERATGAIGSDRILIAPSCSLLHTPADLDFEKHIDDELRDWLAFAKQKLEELVVLERAVLVGQDAVRDILERNRRAIEKRRTSNRIHDPNIKARTRNVGQEMTRRASVYPQRKKLQEQKLKLPLFPTTTIGSFPQTKEVRAARAEYKAGKRDEASYEAFLRGEIRSAVQFQEEVGLDVFVHGEFERNDMVEYFGEQLAGFAVTENGWVQSYGSRCVKPPIIFGDVGRKQPMTTGWSKFAQSLTSKPMKGMLTGPVTILQWSFVRDDQPRSETCRQIALAMRDEVQDLEAAGMRVIQIDEPALREGLPLRRADWQNYLDWAVFCFRLALSGVQDTTQIHTHLCYSKFNDIIEDIARMDADVALIEASRSQFELLEALATYRYPNDIGLGIYDVHSPRVPTTQELVGELHRILQVLPPERIWVNPDCGLKTRRWEEVRPALDHLVEAAHLVRSSLVTNALL